ncbi:MAG: hypothetical protein HY777_07180 [Betaproteobacteria bacterium]|nr:hypothetical protein [Betaproteobacteria bacterium]
MNITPFSEVGVALAEKSGGLTAANINMANSGIANILGFDHLSTKPIQSSDTAELATATANEKKLSLLNAAVSNMAATDALGCGVQASYGQAINCTVSRLADQFQMNSTASDSAGATIQGQTKSVGSTMVTLGGIAYQALLGGVANVASATTALVNTSVEIVQSGIAFEVSASHYALSTYSGAINAAGGVIGGAIFNSQRQKAWEDRGGSIQLDRIPIFLSDISAGF